MFLIRRQFVRNVIFVGLDDTDIPNSPGTNKLARLLLRCLAPDYVGRLVVRHQLLSDPRVPMTSHNSSASILFEARNGRAGHDLMARLRRIVLEWCTPGSDPGLCVAEQVPPDVIQFGRRCQRELVEQREARALAAASGIYLEGLGGSEDGVIGALAAVGLAAGGNDGRVVALGLWPDDLAGPQPLPVLCARGVAEIRCLRTGQTIQPASVDVGRRLRPNFRDGRVVLFVEPDPQETAARGLWRAVRLP